MQLNNNNMELLKVTRNGSLHFKLSDGRIGVSYSSGYVRVSVHGINDKLYQINKLLLKESNKHGYYYERELLPLQRDRLNHLINFNNKNCTIRVKRDRWFFHAGKLDKYKIDTKHSR